jgi:hypothetical protein
MDLDDCPHCGAELEITWTTANPGALLGDQVAVPRSMRCPNANRDEVERLRTVIADIDKLGCATIAMQRDQATDEAQHLRELLGRLEWVEQGYNCVDFDEICPVCQADKGAPHIDDCWLGKELGR